MVWEHESEKELLKRLVDLGHQQVRLLEIIVEELLPPPAVTAVTSLGGTMPLTVGGTTTATTVFKDANGDTASAPKGDGSGLTVTYNSSDTTVATVGAATVNSDGSYSTEVTGVAEGTYTLNTAIENASGAPLVDDDGTTPFVQPEGVSGTVGAAPAGQAVTAVTTIA